MKKCMLVLLIFYCGAAVGQEVRQQPQGEGWLRLSQAVIHADQFFDSNEERLSIRTNAIYTTSLSGALGLSGRLTATLYFPFFVRSTINKLQYNQSGKTEAGNALNSLGDSEIGLVYGFRGHKPFQINGFLKLGLPLGKRTKVGTERDLQTGDGEFNQLIGVQLYYAPGDRYFISGHVAFNNRTEEFSDEIRFGFEAGYKIKKFQAVGRIAVKESLFNDSAPVSLNSVYSNHQEYISPAVEVWYALRGSLSIYSSAAFFPIGRNTLTSPWYEAGLQWALGRH